MIYQENLKVCLRELSSEDFQKRAWLASSGPEISSFAELVAQTFDDTGLGDALGQGELPPELDDAAFSTLKELRRAVSKVDQYAPPEELLTDPKVEKVREIAARALELIEKASKEQGASDR